MINTIIPFDQMDEYKDNQTSLFFFPFKVFSLESYPRGTVGLTVGKRIWLTKIDYRLETTTLLRSLITYVNQGPGQTGELDQEEKVKYAVETLASTDIIYIANVERTTVDNQLVFHVAGKVEGTKYFQPNNVVTQALYYLRSIHYSVNPKFEQGILNIQSELIVAVINPKVWVVRTARNEEVLMLVSGSSCYLTNIKPSAEAIQAVMKFFNYYNKIRNEYPEVMKPALLGKSIFAAVYSRVRSSVVIRPAFFCLNHDGTYRIVHRTFLRTDRRFTISPMAIKLASEPLLDLELVSTREAA